jgi:hypothetical protein
LGQCCSARPSGSALGFRPKGRTQEFSCRAFRWLAGQCCSARPASSAFGFHPKRRTHALSCRAFRWLAGFRPFWWAVGRPVALGEAKALSHHVRLPFAYIAPIVFVKSLTSGWFAAAVF